MTYIRLKRLGQVVSGQSPASEHVSDFADEGLPFLQGNAEFGIVHPSPIYRCDTAPKKAQPGDILLSVRAPVGALNHSNRAYGIGRGLVAIRPRHGRVHPKYLWWVLNASIPTLQAVSTGSTYEAVTADDVGDIRIREATFPEQTSIANYLDRETALIDKLIAVNRRAIDALNERWQITMASGVGGELTNTDFRTSTIPWLPRIPNGWRAVKLNLVARLGSGHTPSRTRPEWWIDPSIPWITTGEVEQLRSDRVEFLFETREMISELGMANSAATLHPAGTVVLCRTASAGYSAIMGRDMATSQDFATWTCGPLITPRFLLLCLRAMRQDLLGRLAMGSTHLTIYMPDISSITVPLPPVEDQRAVVEAVYKRLPAIDAGIRALDRQTKLLRERRQALISAAVAGVMKYGAALT